MNEAPRTGGGEGCGQADTRSQYHSSADDALEFFDCPSSPGALSLGFRHTPLLIQTASTAQRRRKGSSVDIKKAAPKEPVAEKRVRPISGMEEVHGVDVSWLHKPNKGGFCT